MDGRVSVTSPLQGERLVDEWSQCKEQEVSSGPIHWWYHLTTPGEFTKYAIGARREVMRRTRIASILLFFLLLLLVSLVLPATVLSGNRIVLLLICLLLAIVLVAILFNRGGKFHMVGVLVAFGLSGVFYASILMNPVGLTLDSLLLFNGLILVELFIASLLPGSWIFLTTLVNSLFIVTTFMMMPEAPELARFMQTNAYLIIIWLVVLHIVISGVVWLWVHAAKQANERADLAEEVATRLQTIAEKEHTVAVQKHLLDDSIGQIMGTHVQVANGNFAARVSIQDAALLQPLAVALNNLLNRLQRLRQVEQEFLSILPHIQRGKQAEYELKRAKGELDLLLQAIREGRQSNHSIRLPLGGTLLDPLFQEINGQYISPQPSYGKNTTTQLPASDRLINDEIAKK